MIILKKLVFTLAIVTMSTIFLAACGNQDAVDSDPPSTNVPTRQMPANMPPATNTAMPTLTKTPEPTNTAAPLPTLTLRPPTATTTPTPTPENSENVDMAQAVVAQEVIVDHVVAIEVFVPATDETKEYILAYNQNGDVIARYSIENGGDPEWIAGGPFSDEEIMEGGTQFPLFDNSLKIIGLECMVEKVSLEEVDLGGGFTAFITADC